MAPTAFHVALVVVVGDEHGADAFAIEPGRDRARTSLVVRHEPDERRPVKTHERRRWGDLQEPRVARTGAVTSTCEEWKSPI
jgi:hypothetical protein